jgi:hypothetical protein
MRVTVNHRLSGAALRQQIPTAQLRNHRGSVALRVLMPRAPANHRLFGQPLVGVARRHQIPSALRLLMPMAPANHRLGMELRLQLLGDHRRRNQVVGVAVRVRDKVSCLQLLSFFLRA